MIHQVEEMSDLRVAPGFRRIYARVFGILAGQAVDAARRHDKVETIQMDDLEVRVYAKFVRSAKPAPHVNRSATSLRWRKTLDASLNAEIPTFLIVVEVGGVICSALRGSTPTARGQKPAGDTGTDRRRHRPRVTSR